MGNQLGESVPPFAVIANFAPSDAVNRIREMRYLMRQLSFGQGPVVGRLSVMREALLG